MAVNVPLVHISELAEATTAADTDCMVVGGSDAKKITIPNLAKAILAKAAGAVSTIMSANLTASRALVSNGSGKVAVSDITATELGYLEGVKSSVQKQFDELNGNNKTSLSVSSTAVFDLIGSPYVAKVGHLVYVHLAFTTKSARSKGDLISSIPSGYRPAKNIDNYGLFDVKQTAIAAVNISTGGSITVELMNKGSYQLDVCYYSDI